MHNRSCLCCCCFKSAKKKEILYKKIPLKNQFCVISYCKIQFNMTHKQQRGLLFSNQQLKYDPPWL